MKYQEDKETVGPVAICVHGHFYQPTRSEPFTGIIPVEEGAAPYANFNERICAECYAPNAFAGNFDDLSFDVGPTLASWLERAHPAVYRRILEADRRHVERYGVGNALAQPYHHTILPLSCRRDKETQVAWGLADFRHRFDREASGVWLAETAVDLETLDVLAQFGITYTVLAPWQAATPVDVSEPYRVRLFGGRSMTVFFYNTLSGSVSYDDGHTIDANAFAGAFRDAYVNHAKGEARIPQIHLIASDGELYGHHKPYRDQFLRHLLQHSAAAFGLEVCTLERYLRQYPATREVELCMPSSWSCSHGVARWSSGCACTEGERSWKPALRSALNSLAQRGDQLFEQYASEALTDPWAARDGYLPVRHGWQAKEAFWEQFGRNGEVPSIEACLRTMQLLEAQFYQQQSFTSCGFFFGDLDRIEPRNNIGFARRAISLIWQALGIDLQESFLHDLQAARSGRTGLSGADLYLRLPGVPEGVLPRVGQPTAV